MKGKHYTKEIDLYHHEVPAALNPETGEIREIKSSKKRNPDMEYHNEDEVFQKFYTKAWRLLEEVLKDDKNTFAVAFKLALRAEAFSNSLKPLHAESTSRYLAEVLNENKNTIKQIINKLYDLEVIGFFKVKDGANNKDIEYYIFNPYLSFNGKVISNSLETLFKHTKFANI